MREILFAAVLAAAAPAERPPVEVTVAIAPALQERGAIYGDREFPQLADDLRTAVAARAAKGGFTRLELVLDKAIPNRPTPAMLGRNINFALSSLSRGGARVSGVAYGPRGAQPLRFSWWALDLRDSAGAAVWTDMERAFQLLGAELGRGHVPDRFNDGAAPLEWARSGSAVDNLGGRR